MSSETEDTRGRIVEIYIVRRKISKTAEALILLR